MLVAKDRTPTSAIGSPAGPTGFTLLEMLVVLVALALLGTLAVLSLRDDREQLLHTEADRLIAMLEAARAESRATGAPIVWFPIGPLELDRSNERGQAARTNAWQGFAFEVRASSSFSGPRVATATWAAKAGLSLGVRTQPSDLLVLGPDPIIPSQSVIIEHAGRFVEISTDGVSPFLRKQR